MKTMKNTKRLFSLILVLTLAIACIFTASSCGSKDDDNDHTHKLNYVEPKESTCKEAGHEGYNGCSCGYKEEYVERPLADHDYLSVIDEYPSLEKSGKKTMTCSVCGHAVVETIDAYTAAIPDISEAISSMLEDGTYTLSAKEGSGLIYIKEFSEYNSEAGEKSFFALNIAKAEITSIGNSLTGYLKVDVGTATKTLDGTKDPAKVTAPDKFESIFSAEIYLNGSDVSVSVTEEGEKEKDDYNLTALFFEALATEFDMSYDELVNSMYLSEKLYEILPDYETLVKDLEKLDTPKITDEYWKSLEEFLDLVGNNIVTTKTDKNGNKVYTVNVEALGAFVDRVDGKTVEVILSNMYGERSVSSLKANILALPDKTVMDITDSVISTAKKLDIDTDKAFELIDLLIYQSSGEKISIQSELHKNYDKTLCDIVADKSLGDDASAKERNEFIAEFKSQLTEVVDTVFGATIDDLYMLYAGALFSANEEEFSFTKELKDTIDALGEILTIEIVTDANGNLISAEAIMTDAISLIITNDDDGIVATLVWENNEMRVEADENSFEFYIFENDTVTTAGAIEITDTDIDGVITKGISVILSSTEDGVLNTAQLNASYSTSQTYNALSFDINGTGFAIEITDKMIEKSFMAKLTEEYEAVGLISADYKETDKGGVEKEIYTLLVQFEDRTVIDAELTVEDGILSDANAVLNVYESEYNEDTEEYETTLQDTYDITVACTDKENAKYTVTANDYSFVIIADDDTLNFETTIDGIKYTGDISFITNDEDAVLAFHLYADEEPMLAYVYEATANEVGVTIAYYFEMLGETLADYSYGVYSNDNGLTFKYDITKLLLNMPFENSDDSFVIESGEYIEGSGEFTLTFTPAE